MKRVMTTTLLLATAIVGIVMAQPSVSAQDRNCENFNSQSEAQAYFNAGGGSPDYNYNNLDANNDGVACEDYPYGPVEPPVEPSPTDTPIVIEFTPTATAEPPTVTPTSETPTETPTTPSDSPVSSGPALPEPTSTMAAPAVSRGATTVPTATVRSGRSRSAATNPNDPDYQLGQLDAWLAMESAAGETIRAGMADPAFTDAAWYVEQSSAVGIIIAAHAQIQAVEPLTTLREITAQVRNVSSAHATAAGHCDTALVSNTAEDAIRCLDAVERSTDDVEALREALQTWDGASLDYEPST